jgi:enoyl-CoA hydratase
MTVADELLFSGAGGYASLRPVRQQGRSGAVLTIANPNSKVNTVPPQALAEINSALEALEADQGLHFVVFCGGQGQIHAGADVNMFAGGLGADENPPDYEAVERYLLAGAQLDLRIKKLARQRTTVAVMQGERFGGSVEWPLMASYCLASPETGIQLSEATIGIIPGWDGVLNVLLKSGPASALYLGATGTRLDATGMVATGIVTAIAEPDQLMGAALKLAAEAPAAATCQQAEPAANLDTILKVLSERLDRRRYQALRAEAEAKAKELDPKALSKHIDARLGELGKPIAPLAAEAVFGLVARGASLDPADLDAVGELAVAEALLCSGLMRTRDRVAGIDSILKARENPLNKIALYARE